MLEKETKARKWTLKEEDRAPAPGSRRCGSLWSSTLLCLLCDVCVCVCSVSSGGSSGRAQVGRSRRCSHSAYMARGRRPCHSSVALHVAQAPPARLSGSRFLAQAREQLARVSGAASAPLARSWRSFRALQHNARAWVARSWPVALAGFCALRQATQAPQATGRADLREIRNP